MNKTKKKTPSGYKVCDISRLHNKSWNFKVEMWLGACLFESKHDLSSKDMQFEKAAKQNLVCSCLNIHETIRLL